MAESVRILLVEDVATDAELMVRTLRRDGLDGAFERVDNETALAEALHTFSPQIVLSDFSLPGFSGLAALETVQQLRPDTPFIFVSGTIGEERAIESLKRGAVDYVLKTNLAGLGRAVRRALELASAHTARELAERELSNAHQRLRMLSRRFIRVQERERADIARELHDEVGQAFTALKIQLESLQSVSDPAAMHTPISDCIDVAATALGQVRNLSLGLRPPQLDDFGLVPALRWHVERVSRTTKAEISFDSDPVLSRPDPEAEIACFRIAQEALTNALRHARATHIRIMLRTNADEFILIVRDNGVGFDVAAANEQVMRGMSMGLASVQERASLAGGQIRIESSPGNGTEVVARFPLAGNRGGGSGGQGGADRVGR